MCILLRSDLAVQRLGASVRTILTGGSLPSAAAQGAVAVTNQQGLDEGLAPVTPLGVPLCAL